MRSLQYDDRQMTFNDSQEPGIYALISGIDSSIRKMSGELYEFRRDSERRFSDIKTSIDKQDEALSEIRVDVGILKNDITSLKSDVKEMRRDISEMRGDIKAISAQISTAQNKLGWYIALLTIGVSVALVLFQYLIK